MERKIINKEKVFIITVFILSSMCLSFLLRESLHKSLFLFLTILIWIVSTFYTKSISFSSLLYILFVLPFNVTLQLPYSVHILGTEVLLSTPFIAGIYVNYLIPTVSILDIAILLLLASVVVENSFSFYWKMIKDWRNGIIILFVVLITQALILNNFLSLFNSIRLFLYILFFITVIVKFKRKVSSKVYSTILLVFLFNTIIQGVISIIQFSRGASLGMNSIGESQVVAGMQGSSFLELGGQLFLRGYGTFPHPNLLAGYLLLSILVGILFFTKNKILPTILIIFSFIALLFTFTRVSILLAGIFFLVIFVKKIIGKRYILSSFLPTLLLERFMNLFSNRDSGLNDRVLLFKKSFEILKENWFLGVGIGNFVKSMEKVIPRTARGIPLLQPVHNIFLLSISELGSIGFLSLVYVFFYFCMSNIKKWNLIRSLVILYILIIGSFDHYLFSLPQGLMIFSLLLVILCLDHLYNDKENVEKN